MQKKQVIAILIIIGIMLALASCSANIAEDYPNEVFEQPEWIESFIRRNENRGENSEDVFVCQYSYTESLNEPAPMTQPEIFVSVLLEPTLDVDIVYCFNEGMAAVAIYSETWPYYGSFMPPGLSRFFPFGYVNTRGEIVIPLEFCAADSMQYGYSLAKFSEGLVNVRCRERNATGFFDTYGTMVISFEHQFGNPFSDGLARVGNLTVEIINDENKEVFQWGFVNRYGDIVIPIKFNDAQDFSEGLAAVYVRDIGWGYIDNVGEFVIEPQFSYAESFINGVAVVALDGNWGAINKKGDTFTPFIHPVAYSAWGFAPRPLIYAGLLAVPTSGLELLDDGPRWTFFDMDGNKVFSDAWGHNFHEGRLVVRIRISNALINSAVLDEEGGTVVSRDRYNRIHNFTEGMAAVNVNLGNGGIWGLVDGEWYYLNRWGFINRYGVEVIPATFRNVRSFSQGLAAVQCFDTRMWGFINIAGELVVPFMYDDARSFSEGIAWVRSGGTSNEDVCPTNVDWYVSGGLWGLLQIDLKP